MGSTCWLHFHYTVLTAVGLHDWQGRLLDFCSAPCYSSPVHPSVGLPLWNSRRFMLAHSLCQSSSLCIAPSEFPSSLSTANSHLQNTDCQMEPVQDACSRHKHRRAIWFAPEKTLSLQALYTLTFSWQVNGPFLVAKWLDLKQGRCWYQSLKITSPKGIAGSRNFEIFLWLDSAVGYVVVIARTPEIEVHDRNATSALHIGRYWGPCVPCRTIPGSRKALIAWHRMQHLFFLCYCCRYQHLTVTCVQCNITVIPVFKPSLERKLIPSKLLLSCCIVSWNCQQQ